MRLKKLTPQRLEAYASPHEHKNISSYAFAFKTFDLTHLILFHPFHVRRAALELEYAERVQMDGLIYFVYFMLES